MPIAKVGNLSLYYEIFGDGAPLVMIRGVGSNVDHWYEQVETFSKKYRLLVFDNRGIARSSEPGGPFSTRDMATDTITLMEAVGIKKAHVLGYSMGGMIAQEIALNYPEKVDGLILVATDCGISLRVKAKPEVTRLFSDMVYLATPEAKSASYDCLFAKQTINAHPEVIARYEEVSMRFPAPQQILLKQWDAVTQHDACNRLQDIASPTLTITGSEDELIPPQNARVMAEQIPNAELTVINGGGHLFLIEQPEQFNNAVMGFLEKISE